MGLDMSLYKRTYVGNSWKDDDKKVTLNIPEQGSEHEDKKLKAIKTDRISEITESVMYWRKANHVHAWFVENVQDGQDDCKEYYVTTEQLKELHDICKRIVDECPLVDGKVNNGYTFENGEKKYNVEDGKVMSNPEIAEELLPTQSGFFFGGTDYDQYYYEDCVNTVEGIKEVLKEGYGDYYYSSSW